MDVFLDGLFIDEMRWDGMDRWIDGRMIFSISPLLLFLVRVFLGCVLFFKHLFAMHHSSLSLSYPYPHLMSQANKYKTLYFSSLL